MLSPYEDRPPRSFWRSAVSEAQPGAFDGLYRRKFEIGAEDRVATAGSCFAQHVARYMRKSGFRILDVEPAPAALPAQAAREFGYGIYSARYGNIYTARQLLQLMRDAQDGVVDPSCVWTREGRFYDALRPNIEPNGFESEAEVLALRRDHLEKVRELFATMDVFIFTFGLTEAWADRETGRVFPTAPGTIAGSYDPARHEFRNFTFKEVLKDFHVFHKLLRRLNPDVRTLLTVSPVPLTATASDDHVLVATMYSKAVLRAVAGQLAAEDAKIDYFPSYEIVANPWARESAYEPNLRSVSESGVATVMGVFFQAHPPPQAAEPARVQVDPADRHERKPMKREKGRDQKDDEEAVCEDVLLEAFAPDKVA